MTRFSKQGKLGVEVPDRKYFSLIANAFVLLGDLSISNLGPRDSRGCKCGDVLRVTKLPGSGVVDKASLVQQFSNEIRISMN
jgi:hypothetical protein